MKVRDMFEHLLANNQVKRSVLGPDFALKDVETASAPVGYRPFVEFVANASAQVSGKRVQQPPFPASDVRKPLDVAKDDPGVEERRSYLCRLARLQFKHALVQVKGCASLDIAVVAGVVICQRLLRKTGI
jgi:hypothetical protein